LEKYVFFHCGEYGEQLGRPHYHACLFGFDFPDKDIAIVNGKKVKFSESLNKIWGKGYCTLGDVTFESAAYVARYIVKKVSGKNADWFYKEIDFETGEYTEKQPEYVTMSRKPGIAFNWFDKYKKEVYPSDSIVINGKEMKPPKFYDSKFEIIEPITMRVIKSLRKDSIPDGLELSLDVREKIMNINNKKKGRNYENVSVRNL